MDRLEHLILNTVAVVVVGVLLARPAVAADTDEHRREGQSPTPPLEASRFEKYVEGVFAKVEAEANLSNPVRLTLVDSPVVQGMSYYGTGEITVTRGMVNMMLNEAELACLLGHELAHQALRHGVGRSARRLDLGLLASSLAAEAIEDPALSSTVREELDGIAFGLWSRTQEEDADRTGVQLCAGAGYDPTSFTELFERLSSRVKDAPFLNRLKGSHRSLRRRADAVRSFLKEEGSVGGLRWYSRYIPAVLALRAGVAAEPEQGGRPFMEERIEQPDPVWGSAAGPDLDEICRFLLGRADFARDIAEMFAELRAQAIREGWDFLHYKTEVKRQLNRIGEHAAGDQIGGIHYDTCESYVDTETIRESRVKKGENPDHPLSGILVDIAIEGMFVHEDVHANDCAEYSEQSREPFGIQSEVGFLEYAEDPSVQGDTEFRAYEAEAEFLEALAQALWCR